MGWLILGAIIGITVISPVLSGEITFQEVLAYSDNLIEKSWKIVMVVLE